MNSRAEQKQRIYRSMEFVNTVLQYQLGNGASLLVCFYK
jgi:hypothetical protein